jgi:hypothetical protein
MKIVESPETMSQCIPSKGHTYWNESDVKDGKWVVLPTMRVARLHHVTDCGRKVFITPAGKLVCEHGECASSIGSWVSAEQAAQRVDEQPFSRNSICDCQNTDGMHWGKAMPSPLVPLDPPADTLFGVLDALGTHKVTVRGRTLRHVPYTCDSSALFVAQKGGFLCCRHGHSLSVLKAIEKGKPTKFRGGACTCSVTAPPRRILGFKKHKCTVK